MFQHQLDERFSKFKDLVAIEYGEKRISYHELEQTADSLACRILNDGTDKGTFIGILLEDRVSFIASVIAVLKAGCVFVPLEPSQPAVRLRQMLESADVKLLLTEPAVRQKFSGTELLADNTIQTVDVNRRIEGPPAGKPAVEYSPADKIYIYFTSGTSGRPKAILGKNRSLQHFINWEIATFGIDRGTRVSQFTTPGFDVF